jgi:hypothetical protein
MLDMMTMILVFLLKSLSASTAQLPQSKDLTLPISPLSAEQTAEPSGLPIIITTHQILFGDKNTLVADLPSQDNDKRNGVDARYKDNSRNEYHVSALATKVKEWREADLRRRQSDPTHPDQLSEAVIIADQSTPFRILYEVIATLGEVSGFGKFHLMVLMGGSK